MKRMILMGLMACMVLVMTAAAALAADRPLPGPWPESAPSDQL